MESVKQIIHDIADHLPDQATFDDAMCALYVHQSWNAPYQLPGKARLSHRKQWKNAF